MLNTRKITVSVTDKHMQEGIKKNCLYCPIALALYDAIGLDPKTLGEEEERFAVVGSHVTFYEMGEDGKWGRHHMVSELPDSATLFVKYFDQGFHSLAPFSFELEVPESLICG